MIKIEQSDTDARAVLREAAYDILLMQNEGNLSLSIKEVLKDFSSVPELVLYLRDYKGCPHFRVNNGIEHVEQLLPSEQRVILVDEYSKCSLKDIEPPDVKQHLSELDKAVLSVIPFDGELSGAKIAQRVSEQFAKYQDKGQKAIYDRLGPHNPLQKFSFVVTGEKGRGYSRRK